MTERKIRIQKHTNNVPIIHTDDKKLFKAIQSHFLTLKNENTIIPFVLTCSTVLKSVLDDLKNGQTIRFYRKVDNKVEKENVDRIRMVEQMISIAIQNSDDIMLFLCDVDPNKPSFN